MNLVPPTSQHYQSLPLLNPNQVYSFKWTEFPILEYLEETLRNLPSPPLPNIQEYINLKYSQVKGYD